MSFWKVLRILVTDTCNYRCIYCHNEGQHSKNMMMLKFDDVKKVISALNGSELQEIRFSGGEPFTNKETIDMIEWVSKNTNCEIGCATNGQLLNEDIIKRLADNKVKLTLHYATNTSESYKFVTDGNYDKFIENIDLLNEHNVDHSFNFVLYPEIFNEFEGVLESVVCRGRGLKLLPYIEQANMNKSNDIIKTVRSLLDEKCISKIDVDGEGIEIWKLENGSKIKLLHSPCYRNDLESCKEYGEVRLLPNLQLQKCIMDSREYKLNMDSKESIRKDFQDLWNSFTKCSQNIIKE